MRTYFYGFSGPFHENLVFSQKADAVQNCGKFCDTQYMSKKYRYPILYSKLLYKMGNYFLDTL